MTNSMKNISTAMIIDDNVVDQMLYKRIIKRSERIENVLCYTDATKALEFLKRNDREKVDVIFLDINMPRMNGFEFLEAAIEQLGSAFDSAVVVMLTTSLAKEDQERADQFDVIKAYLTKPFEIKYIHTIVDEIVNKSGGKL